ncbi:MAG: hypothetical protein P4L64_08420 [Caulobacteraceae bacterium]|nr:hypothetical protein [Caulobacteraceae bacterium]
MSKSGLFHTVLSLAAWVLAAFVVFATLGPQGLRPHLGDAQTERFAAYFVTAAAFVIAYPRRAALVAPSAVAIAILLELGQRLAPGRDAGLHDAIAKAMGGVAGALAADLGLILWGRLRSRDGT